MAEHFVDLKPKYGTTGHAVALIEASLATAGSNVEIFLAPVEGKPSKRPRRGNSRGSALFRDFADLPLEPEPIREWAEQHGFLGPLEEVVQEDDRTAMGEPLARWIIGITRMREVLELWGWYRRRDYPRLASEPLIQALATTRGMSVDPRAHREALLGLAAEALAMRVESGFQSVRGREDYWPTPVRPQLTVGTNRPFAFQLVGEYLAGALWLQLALAIDGNKEYRRCAICGNWWEVAPDIARTNRVYCSTACRQIAYRKRNAKGATNA